MRMASALDSSLRSHRSTKSRNARKVYRELISDRHAARNNNTGGVMYGNPAARAEQRASGEAGVSATDMLDLQTIIEKLMSRLRLAVIFGGNKTAPGSVIYPAQNTRSWKSYESVAEDIAASLRRIGFRHVELMPEDMRLAERLA